jgi:cytochrome c biogenesis protein CcdA
VITRLSLHGTSRESGIVVLVVYSAGMDTMVVFFRRLVGEIMQRDYVDFILRPPRAEELRRRALRVLDELR